MWSCLTVPASLWVWSQKLTSILDLLQTKDQTWTAGNLALQDSLRLKVPVRVVRGSHEKIKCASDQHVYVSAVAALSRCYLADMMIITCQHGRCDSIMCRSGSSFAVIDFVAKHVSCVLCSSLLHAHYMHAPGQSSPSMHAPAGHAQASLPSSPAEPPHLLIARHLRKPPAPAKCFTF